MKTTKMLGQLFLALTIAIGFTACSKNDELVTPPINAFTTLRLVFASDAVTVKSAGSKVDLTKASSVKIKYTVNEGGIGIHDVKEATLMLKGDSTKVSTYDMKILTVKGGSKLTIYAATLFDNKEHLLGGWSKEGSDVFEVSSPEGINVMERTYGTIGIDRLF